MHSLLSNWPIYLFSFIFGTLLTSFIGLAVTRLPHQLRWCSNPRPNLTIWSPRSQCDHCQHPIQWRYLLPIIGYLFCAGRCQQCHTTVPYYYPILEFIGGIATLTLLHYYGFTHSFFLISLLAFALFFLAWIDLIEHWLPAEVTLPLFWIGLLTSPFSELAIARIQGAAAGFAITYTAMWLTSKICAENAMAGGDIALITVAGAWLGIHRLFAYIIICCLLFMVYALPARLKGQRFFPMAPALSLGFILVLLPWCALSPFKVAQC